MNVPKETLEVIGEALSTAYERLDMIDPDDEYREWDESCKEWYGVAVEKAEVLKSFEVVQKLLKEDV